MVASRHTRLISIALAAAAWLSTASLGEFARATETTAFGKALYEESGYDPFESLEPVTAGGPATCAYEGNGPQFGEPLPEPPAATAPPANSRQPNQSSEMPANPPAADSPADPHVTGDVLGSIRPLDVLGTNIGQPNGMLPRDYWAERTPQATPYFDTCGATRGWPVSCFHWNASCLCHNPLYFEEPNLERYGYGCGCTCYCSDCCQSAVSAAHFFATIPALPYMMTADCPGECEYVLGEYRPGSCPPWRYTCCTPWDCKAAASEGMIVTGLFFLIP
jgi:hypothetical protein